MKMKQCHMGAFMLIGLIFGISATVGAQSKETISPEAAGYSSVRLDKIRGVIDPIYEDGRIPNYVIALYKGNRVFYSAVRGNVRIGTTDPVGTDTIFHMASMSKPMVSTAILRLIEEGRLSLDSTLPEFFPEFKNMYVAPGGDFDSRFEEANRDITVRDLLTHTSGFTYGEAIIGFGDVAKQYDELSLIVGPQAQTKTISEHMATLAQIPLVAQPGTSFNYSVSIDVLGAIIEKVVGVRLSDHLSRTIFEPLGMKDTGFDVPTEKRHRYSYVYTPATREDPAIGNIDGDPIDWKLTELPRASEPAVRKFDSGGGGIQSTADDYATYLNMVANQGSVGGTRILNESTAALHTKNLVPGLGLESFRETFGDAAKFMSFGGGFGIKKEEDGSGNDDYYFWGGAYNTFFWIDGDKETIGVFLTHHYPVQYNISDQIEQIVDEARL